LQIVCALCLVAALLTATPLFAQTTFPGGSKSKATGMDSALTATSAPALLYNPANLSDSGPSDLYTEVGYTQVVISYEHPDFDQVHVRVRSPYAVLGYVKGFNYDRVHLGVTVFPAKYGGQKIPGLPRRVAGKYIPLDVENYEQSIKLGLGISYKFDQGTSIGFSLIESYEHKILKAETPHSSEELINLNAKNYFTRPVFGLYHQVDTYRFSFAFLPQLKKTYKGSQKSASTYKQTDPTVADFEPATLSFGAGGDWNYFSVGSSVNYRLYSKGRRVFREGITSSAREADLHDTVEYNLELGYRISRTMHATIAYAVIPSPWGPGKYTSETEEQISGADFGDSEAVDRRVVGAGLGTKLSSIGSLLHLSVMHAKGVRTLPSGADRPGHYQVNIWTFSSELTYAF
jgi:hypothetical protein